MKMIVFSREKQTYVNDHKFMNSLDTDFLG